MRAILVGGGKLAYFLARLLISKGYRVTIINRDRAECASLAQSLGTVVICRDGSEPQALAEAEADAADVLLAVTPNDEDNLVICQLGVSRHGVPRAVALANDPDNETVFERLGIRALSTTRILVGLIEQSAGFGEISNLLPVGEGKVNLTQVVVTANSPVAGQSLSEISLPADALIACVLRDGRPIIPRGATRLDAGDRVIVLTLPESYGQVLRALTTQ